jgi:hypothetical protein
MATNAYRWVFFDDVYFTSGASNLPATFYRNIPMKSILPFAFAALVGGCASIAPADIAKRDEVTVEAALNSIGCGIKRMYDGQRGLTTGLIPSEVEVRFALSVSAKDSGQLTIDFSKSVGDTNGNLKSGTGIEKSSEAALTNTITIKFVNVLTAPKDSLIHDQSPAQVRELLILLREEGVRSLGQKGPSMVVFDATDCPVVKPR